MLTGMRHTAALLLGFALLALVVACGGTAEPTVDIDATVEARVELAKSDPTITAPIPTRDMAAIFRTAVAIVDLTRASLPPPIVVPLDQNSLYDEAQFGQVVTFRGLVMDSWSLPVVTDEIWIQVHAIDFEGTGDTCCQSATMGQIGTRENCRYGELALSSLTVRL